MGESSGFLLLLFYIEMSGYIYLCTFSVQLNLKVIMTG